MSRSIGDVVRDQITPIVGADEARLIAVVADIIAEALSESVIGQMEDHVVMPALMAVIGRCMVSAAETKIARADAISKGMDILPSLYPGNERILEILHATLGPDPKPELSLCDQLRKQALAARMVDEDFLGTTVIQ